MNSTPNKTVQVLTEKVALKLANLILTIQIRSSMWLNQRFNACSTRGKKRLTITIGLLTALLLIAGSFCPFYTIPKLSQYSTSVHIGLPSELPKSQITKRQLTDSLTKKK